MNDQTSHGPISELQDYELVGRIATGATFELVRVRRLADGATLLLKRTVPPAAAALRNEYALLQSLPYEGVIQPVELLDRRGRLAMLLEDFAGEWLEAALTPAPVAWQDALVIAGNLARVLVGLHEAHVTHQDIRPATLLLESRTGRVCLIDFSVAAHMRQNDPANGDTPQHMPGDWAYLAPEQTGRSSHPIDARTDLYCLGLILYRMLAGRLPFHAQDPVEWVHCHVARTPPEPSAWVEGIPQPVSAMVMRLLAKVPQDRYQTARGLTADIEQCLAQWRSGAQIHAFELGQADFPDRLQIPRKLYGRDTELALLLQTFARVLATGQPELVTVTGSSGSGKSSLVQEMREPIERQGGYFIAGKFDQYQGEIPYATVTQALRDLSRQLLAASDTGIAQWRQDIQAAVGADGQVLIEVLPEIQLIIGPQPEVPVLPPTQQQQRFRAVFQRFVMAFCRRKQPLILFLDDVQWIDPASLELITSIMTHPDTRHLLLLLAYRGNELRPEHPLPARVAAIRGLGLQVAELPVQPLSRLHLNRLVSDTLRTESSRCEPLTQVIFRRTQGNPFFFVQFLRSLHQEGLLRWQAQERSWTWQLTEIEGKDLAGDAVELIIGKLQRLAPQTQQILQFAACLGNRFEWHSLALASGHSQQQLQAHLAAAAYDGLIAQSADAGKFLHDRIQQASYALIPASERSAIHLRIGRALAAHGGPDWIDDKIFEIVNQLNRGAGPVQSPEERYRIATLNVRAGKRAKQSAAYDAALNYFATAEGLLDENRWEHPHGEMFELGLLRAQSDYLTADLESAEEHLAKLSPHANNLIEQAAITCLGLELYMTANRSDRAVQVALDYLRRIGIQWTPRPGDEEVKAEYEQLWQRIGTRSFDDLIDLPAVRDPQWEGTLRVLASALPAAAYTSHNLWCIMVTRFVSLSVEHGNSEASPFGYVSFARILGSRFGEYGRACRLGQLACELADRHGLSHFSARVYLSYAVCVSSWAKHIQAGRALVRRAFDTAARLGDLTFMGYCYSSTVSILLANGDPLSEALTEAERGLAFARKARSKLLIDNITPQHQLVRTLRGLTIAFGSFNDTEFDESRFEKYLESDPRLATVTCVYWTRKLQSRFMAGDHALALEAATHAQPLLWTSRSLFEIAEYHLFAALAWANHLDSAPPEARNEHLQTIVAHHQRLAQWALQCPDNFQDRATLVAAELARVQGHDAAAIRGYEQAAHCARERGFVQNEALANELAARYFLSRGSATAAQGHLEAAHSAYARWGATSKVEQLEEQFPQLRSHPLTPQKSCSPGSATALQGAAQLDFLAVTKASQAISGKIVLEELIDTLMRIVIESAGARTGTLLLKRGNTLTPAAEGDALQEAVRVRLHSRAQPLESVVPASMVNYVHRSRSMVLLGDALESNPFTTDPYFSRQHPRSVLCLPILRQAELIGVLYMENDLFPYAFTPERVSVLELLTVQIAISIGSAQLYEDLRLENQERRRAEQSLREQEARIRRLVDSNIIGIFFWTFDGKVTAANDALLQMIGHSREDLLSGTVNWIELTPPDYRALDVQKLQDVRNRGVCAPYEKEYLHKDGHRVPVMIGATAFEDATEAGVAFVLDLSERKQAEADRHARQVAEAANRAKSDFLARMSHDLRTPLNAILGYAQILQQDPDLAECQRQRASIIQHSGKHLLQLIDDILDLAKIEAGKLELSKSVFALRPFLQLLADMVSIKAGQKGLAFVCDSAPHLPAYISADERRLLQVLLNLSSNAVKFTDQGEVRIEARSPGPGRLHFAVHDTGIGIPADRLDMIFQPFAQLGSEQHRNAGTGLGLNISRQLVQLMGSDIHARSVVGHGSSFWFDLELPIVAAVPSMPEPGAPVRSYEGRRRNILIIDDDHTSRVMLADWLRSLGFSLFEAALGTVALEQAQRIQPDLVLTDLAMPELDGFETIRRLRALPNFEHLPIIAISAGVWEADAERSLTAGANAFLPKPVSLSQLQVQMTALLEIQWTHEEPLPDLTEEAITTPPPSVLGRLRQLAQEGNMRELAQEAGYIAALDPSYGPFSKRVQSLAGAYETKAVLSLIESANRG
ncbi:MAG: AAA family ATPase [Steroidobacteraceae bacterium]